MLFRTARVLGWCGPRTSSRSGSSVASPHRHGADHPDPVLVRIQDLDVYASQALGVSRQTALQKVKRGELNAVPTA
jgi:hypothetical protein